jgi:chromosome segregation ATPase
MAARKRVSRPRKAASKGKPRAASAGAGQLGRLTATVQSLHAKLMAEARRRKLDQRLLAEANRARLKVAKQISALRAQGLKLASQLKRAARDASAREEARQAALAKIAELREDLRRKREEVRRTSTELAKLARESATRAREIVHSGGIAAEATKPQGESVPPAPQDGPVSEKPPI